jgi:Outer membrane protein beta-barrel domain
MTRRVSITLVLAAVALLASSTSFAGVPGLGKMWTFGIGGGAAVPVNDAKDALKNGFNGLAYARVQVPIVGMTFGMNVSFHQLDLKDATFSTGGGSPTPVTGSTSVLSGFGDLRYDLMPGPIHPYITAGLGAYNVNTSYNATGLSGSESGTHFGVNGGAGVSLHFGSVSGYAQARIDNVYTDTGGPINTKSIQVVPVTVGIEF